MMGRLAEEGQSQLQWRRQCTMPDIASWLDLYERNLQPLQTKAQNVCVGAERFDGVPARDSQRRSGEQRAIVSRQPLASALLLQDFVWYLLYYIHV